MKQLLILLTFVILSCGSQAPETRPSIESRPSEIKLLYTGDNELKQWGDWAKKAAEQICTEFGLEPITEIRINVSDPVGYLRIDPETHTEEVIYVQGYYYKDDSAIEVWIRNPIGIMAQFETFEQTVLHEMMHHYYKCNNLTNPKDHNELFNREIERLCWVDYKKK